MPTVTSRLSDDEKNLIIQLREEAQELKECYTKFSFQAFAIIIAVFGLVTKFQDDDPLIAFTLVPGILIILVVGRIGIYKYGTANRNFGYELHLYRSLHLKDSLSEGWQSYMREIGWEEAMKAWRVVQATVFDHLYYTDIFGSKMLRKKYRSKKYYRWFDPDALIDKKKGARYKAGNYLKMMNRFLLIIAIISTIPMFIATYQIYLKAPGIWIVAFLVSLFMLGLGIKEIIYFRRRRNILESGLLSIHSCAIVWQAVVVCHYRAIQKISGIPDHISFRNYTQHLSEEAISLTEDISKIHQWVISKPPLHTSVPANPLAKSEAKDLVV
jgi:hypothetical protein